MTVSLTATTWEATMQTVIFDRKSIAAALDSSIGQVLETMFFTCVSSTVHDGDNPAAAWVTDGRPDRQKAKDRFGAHVRFSGQCKGEFAFSLDTASLLPVAMDFLGRDHPPASEQEFGSIVCEMGNMFCGSLLSSLESESVFHLAPPCLDRGESSFAPPPGSLGASFTLDPGDLYAWIHFEAEGN
jgi:hypothetical protein